MQPGKFMDDPPVNPAITNTYQAMLAWDSSRTFACFFYPTGGIQWAQAATMMGPAAVVRVHLCATHCASAALQLVMHCRLRGSSYMYCCCCCCLLRPTAAVMSATTFVCRTHRHACPCSRRLASATRRHGSWKRAHRRCNAVPSHSAAYCNLKSS